MKYHEVYNTVNEILKMVGKPSIKPLDGVKDDKAQIDHIYEEYLNMYLKAFPQWIPFRNKPNVISDMGVEYLLKAKNSV